jgi:membrane fusion protein, multidrug efflux system
MINTKSKWIRIIVAVVILIVIGIFFKSCSTSKEDSGGKVYIAVGKPKIGDLKQSVEAQGKVKSINIRNIYPDVEIKVKKVLAKEGDIVKKGTTLLNGRLIGDSGSSGEYTFVSPIDGVVTKIATIDQSADSSTSIAEISEFTKLFIEANIPQKESEKIAKGQNVEIKTLSGNQTIKGKVSRVSSIAKEIDGDRGKINVVGVDIVFDNDKQLMKLGYDVNITINTSESKDAMSIPKTSIVTEDNKQFIYVLDSKNIVHKKEVTTGIEDESNIQIKSGLNKTDRVITLISSEVKDGAHIDTASIKNV